MTHTPANEQHTASDGANLIQILIIDDHPAILVGLSSMLSTHPNLRVAATCESSKHVGRLQFRDRIDVVLLDLRIPGMTGVESIHAVRNTLPTARILIISSYETDEEIHKSLSAGAYGYITKSAPQEEIVFAIRRVANGRRYLNPALAKKLAHRSEHALTSRETELLHYVARGLTNKQIGEHFGLSEHTVRNHVNSIIGKMGAQDRTEAAVAALKRGIISIETL
jgi:DNA-binding NarL/FixJ family response regulator